LGQTDRAEALDRHAVELNERAAAEHPDLPGLRQDVARALSNLASLREELGQLNEAEGYYRRALNNIRALTVAQPAVPEYRQDMASILSNLSNVLRHQQRLPESESAIREALAVRQKLVADFPDLTEHRQSLAASYHNLGIFLLDRDQIPAAEAELRHALKLYRDLATASPNEPELQVQLGITLNQIGNVCYSTKRYDEAETAYRDALERYRTLAKSVPAYGVDVAFGYDNLGNIQTDRRQLAAALESYTKALDLARPIMAKDDRGPRVRSVVRNAHWGRADVLAKLGRYAEAVPEWDKMLELFPDVPDRQNFRLQRAESLARSGDPTRAEAEAESVADSAGATGSMLYEAACIAVSASAGLKDRPAEAERWAARAVLWLGRAKDAGFFKAREQIEHLKTDPELAGIRGREDFKKLVAGLAAAPAP
jgi:tetratricopeptide (TPR) repeat protein